MDRVDEPEEFIVRFRHRVRPEAEVLDIGCGKGRHALLFARAGCRVLALDRSRENLESVADRARAEGLHLEAVESDTEQMSLLPNCVDAIVNTLFLHRPLFPQFVIALRPGGLLFFRTFTTGHADVLGKERPSRRFLLEPGELRDAFAGLDIEYYDESIEADRAMATLVASRPGRMTE